MFLALISHPPEKAESGWTHSKGGQSGVAVRRQHCMHEDVGSNPAAARNENTDFGQTPAQKVP